MRLLMHNPRKGKPVLIRTKSGRKLVAERLAQLADRLIAAKIKRKAKR